VILILSGFNKISDTNKKYDTNKKCASKKFRDVFLDGQDPNTLWRPETAVERIVFPARSMFDLSASELGMNELGTNYLEMGAK
jgi:hypothetical protein